MPEEWRTIPGYEGAYEVSNLGRVRSLDRLCCGQDGRKEAHYGRILSPQRMRNGYLEVRLSRRKHRTIHSLVAETFLGPRPAGTDVMHIDGNRGNNAASNLQYGSRADNLHSTYSYGGKQANGKLSLRDVDDIRLSLMRGESGCSIARRYGVHPSTVYHIRDGKAFGWYSPEVNYAR